MRGMPAHHGTTDGGLRAPAPDGERPHGSWSGAVRGSRVDVIHHAREEEPMADANPSAATPTATKCARCEKTLTESDRVAAQDRVFCRSCYEVLKFELKRTVASMSENINYPMAVLGAVLGGAAGVL